MQGNKTPAKKPPRKRCDFQDNITASLSLPKTVKKKLPTKTDGASYYTSMVYETITNLIFKPAAATNNKNIDDSNQIKISHRIKEIEAIRQQLSEDKKVENDKLLLEEVELLEYQIKEHAARRVDLFFYLLLAVYNTNVKISKGDTTKQHGRGSKEHGTQACHCSLFPGLKLTQPAAAWFTLFSATIADLSDTYFEDALNMTVELPSVVNAFDGHIEGRYEPTRHVEACLEILNEAARGEIDPIQGMTRFFRTMNSFFERFEKNHLKKGRGDTPMTDLRIWEYQKAGTFEAAKPDLSVNEDYVYMMLRLTPAEIKATWVPVVAGQVLARNYKLIQQELLAKKVGVQPAKKL